jgi:pyruvate formate lyase activating enzyme
MKPSKVRVFAPEILPLSLCDYLGEPACLIFFSGCNYDCGYCQNWRLKARSKEHLVDIDKIKESIRKNRLITACKVTGGEPLLQLEALSELGKFVKSLGLKFGIDTNGSLPDSLKVLIPTLDLVSIDIKTALNEGGYRKITGVGKPCVDAVRRSLEIVMSSNAYADVRMVVIPGYNDSKEVVLSVAGSLRPLGYEEKARRGMASLTLVEFVPENAKPEEFRRLKNPSAEDLRSLALASGLPNVRITHRTAGFYKEVGGEPKKKKEG